MHFMGLALILATPIFPPGLVIGIILLWMSYRREEAMRKDRLAFATSPPIGESNPGPCPDCGEINWLRSEVSVIPANNLRSFQFPMEGNAAVARFNCMSCGAGGRYGRSYTRRQDGWILLGRFYGGW
jgi:hypothetical protein